ncbi:RNA polymerase sigma factor [Gemmatimonas sp.]|uniref:RNA polymerase sigma factor n=1 Tax=Gemmatimonas sp. TaxID=1962908 RepID=UPI0039838980
MTPSVSSSLPDPDVSRPATLNSLSAIRAGDPDALASCYRAHAPMLMALALRLTASRQDAEDIVHDVFVGLPEALVRYDERGQFGAWIARVTTRVALMRQRQVRQRGDVSLVDIAEPATSTPDGDPVLQEKVLQALATLTPPLRHVFVLRVIEGYSHAEIAGLLEISTNTSEVRLHRAVQQLRRLLEAFV